jgi:hypothetical protein
MEQDARREKMAETKGLPLNDFRKLDIRDGVIYYKIYAQDGSFIPMNCRDTISNRLFVSWVQKFDRYTVSGEEDD